jgi:hypothetical protein
MWIAAGLAFSLVAPVFADTPIGPGVTGSGGTGANKSDDPSTGAGPGTEVRQADREGNGSTKGRAITSGDVKAGRTGATGATSGSGAGISGSKGSSGKDGASRGTTQY